MSYWYLIPICLAITVVFLFVEHEEKQGLAVCLKGLASLVFVAFGYLGSRGCSDTLFVSRVMAGLILGCIADVLLNLRFVFPKMKSFFFLFGTAVFLSGHVLYLIALLPKCTNLAYCLIADVILSAAVILWMFKKLKLTPVFQIFGIVYIGTIMTMVTVAGGIFFAAPAAATGIYFAGAMLFLISDLILVFNTFGGNPTFGRRVANLEIYYIGQLLIGLSLQFVK